MANMRLSGQSNFGDHEREPAALKRLDSTLRHLELDISSPSSNPSLHHDLCLSLEKVLDVCTNLISLKTGHILMNRNALSQYPTLRRLELGSHQQLTTSDMELILPAFPLLEHLAIRRITDSRLLSLVHTCCPNLSFLEYNTPLIRDKLPSPSTTSTAETPGLRFLYIELSDPSNDLKDVIDITMRHHKTLEHLLINLKENQRFDQSSPLSDTTTLTFNNLAHVHFGIRGFDGWEPLGSKNETLIQEGLRFFVIILRQSPNLQTLRLSGEALDPQVLHPSLGHLHHLNKNCHGEPYLSVCG